MASLFSALTGGKKDAVPTEDYEKILSSINNRLKNLEKSVRETRARCNAYTKNILFYGVSIYLVLLVYLFFLRPRYVPNSSPIMSILISLEVIIAFPIGLVFLYRAVGWIYARRLIDLEARLSSCRRRQAEKIEELKRITAYDRTRDLIQRYEVLESPSTSLPPIPGQTSLVQDSVVDANKIINRPYRLHDSIVSGNLSKTPSVRPFGPSNMRDVIISDVSDARISSTVVPSSKIPIKLTKEMISSPILYAGKKNFIDSYKANEQNEYNLNINDEGLRGHLTKVCTKKSSSRSWLDRILDVLIGDDQGASKYALICERCSAHNGLAHPEQFASIRYRCPHCQHLNINDILLSNSSFSSDNGTLSVDPDQVSIDSNELVSTTKVSNVPCQVQDAKSPSPISSDDSKTINVPLAEIDSQKDNDTGQKGVLKRRGGRRNQKVTLQT